MQVLRRENPMFAAGLTIPQRLTYAATLLGWFDAWRSLGYLLLPVVVIATGAVPIKAEPLTFAFAFGTQFILGQLALRVLSRGCHRPVLSILFEFVRMTPNLLATLTLFRSRAVTFRVTPKGRVGRGQLRDGELREVGVQEARQLFPRPDPNVARQPDRLGNGAGLYHPADRPSRGAEDGRDGGDVEDG